MEVETIYLSPHARHIRYRVMFIPQTCMSGRHRSCARCFYHLLRPLPPWLRSRTHTRPYREPCQAQMGRCQSRICPLLSQPLASRPLYYSWSEVSISDPPPLPWQPRGLYHPLWEARPRSIGCSMNCVRGSDRRKPRTYKGAPTWCRHLVYPRCPQRAPE